MPYRLRGPGCGNCPVCCWGVISIVCVSVVELHHPPYYGLQVCGRFALRGGVPFLRVVRLFITNFEHTRFAFILPDRL